MTNNTYAHQVVQQFYRSYGFVPEYQYAYHMTLSFAEMTGGHQIYHSGDDEFPTIVYRMTDGSLVRLEAEKASVAIENKTPLALDNLPLMISIDLETRGQNPATCAIASIGMAVKQWNAKGWLKEFYCAIDAQSALRFGKEDKDTMQWWEHQSEQAREALNGNTNIMIALVELANEIRGINPQDEDGHYSQNVVVVSRAPSFDLAILSRHFQLLGIKQPWAYWQERDHRTFETAWREVLMMMTGQKWLKYSEYQTVAHHALQDAKQQADYLNWLVQNMQNEFKELGVCHE